METHTPILKSAAGSSRYAILRDFLNKPVTVRQIIFVSLLVICFTPWVNPPIALALGLVVAQLIGHPFLHINHKATHWLLQVSVVGLGFGMHVNSALQAGKTGILFTVASIAGTLVLGYGLGRFLKIDRKTSHLIAGGTAICGGSAIAALSPVLKAEEKQISVALGVIFMLNSLALFLFPIIGHIVGLSQTQFGLWAAIAIHDTSSVVGAAEHYGAQALQIATTVKLARALWIIPVSLGTAMVFRNPGTKISIPYFIGWFVVAMLVHSYIPQIEPLATLLVMLSKKGLTLTLFLIGAGLSGKVLKAVGVKPLVQGVLLWVAISGLSLWVILQTVL